MIYQAVCTKCKTEHAYTATEESKMQSPVCCGKPTVFFEEKRKMKRVKKEDYVPA